MRLLTILFFLLSFSSLATAQAYLSPQLTEALALGEPLEVVVAFQGNDAPTAADLSLLNTLGITQGATLQSLPIAGVIATPAQINSLAANPNVRSIFLNYAIDYENNRATAITGVDQLRTDPIITAQNGGLPVSGHGIGVIINDSGVDGTHPDLEFGANLVQNVAAHANLNSYSSILPYTPIEDVPNTDAAGGHGTHVAGIVGGTGMASQGLYEGVAPGADLIGYGAGAAVALLDILSAFDYAIVKQFQYGIRVVTNSWGTTSDVGTDFNPADPINVATKKCTDRNIVIVFSAGNSGASSGTITGNYKKAPWVICVAAGDKQGRLTDFSSRGRAGVGGTVVVDGQTFTWEDRPTVTSPGKAIISTRAISPIGLLGTPDDIETIEPAHLPFYTTLDGTSMAAPHVAGIVALMLEADPTLNPYEVKAILQQTATNIPGRAGWEVGAGYVNAYAAVNTIFGNASNYGSSLNINRNFNGNVVTASSTENFAVDYFPGDTEQLTFEVAPGTTSLEAKTVVGGVLGETGNLLNLVLFSPSGQRYSAGIPVTFTLSVGRGVAVASPEAGTWTLSIEGLNGLALPETVEGTITQSVISGATGLDDVNGHPNEASIRLAISNRLMDSNGSNFEPTALLTRLELADYLMMGQGVRQYFSSTGVLQFPTLSGNASLLAESVMAIGAALRDGQLNNSPLMTTATNGFVPNGTVTRAELAYTLAQSLGLEDYANSLANDPITVNVDGETIEVEDANDIPTALRGHVQAALNLNLINVYYSLTQNPFGLGFTIHAHFQPNAEISRVEFAVIATRTFEQWVNPTQNFTVPQSDTANADFDLSVYPNPTTDRLFVKTNMLENEIAGKVSLLNNSGQVVYQNQTLLFPYGEIQVNVANYPKGQYFLRLETATGEQYTKAIVLN
ncbi:S8 family serine peptidase [Lewinella sp. LCG006]|uniref:S8 family serine peptidase n=1 Tax=Lewinella sp. LCG006 TaxID=3231911 RepID=UPI0034602C45